MKNFLPYRVYEKGNDLMIDCITFDSITGRVYTKRIVIKDGMRRDKHFSIRLYNLSEIRFLLNKVGLEIYKVYSDFNSQPFTSDSKRMVIIARKPFVQ